jgi:preprotein translocase subunit SecD
VASTSVRELLAQEPRHAVPPKAVIVTCGKAGDRFCPGVNDAPPRRVYYYLFRHDPAKHVPALTAADLTPTGARANFGPNGDPIVLLQFTRRGNRRFQEVTRAEFVRGRRGNQPQHFAIVLDDDIKSFPQIDYTDPQLADGISGGGQITGIGSTAEAKRLAVVLETGELPVRFVPVR